MTVTDNGPGIPPDVLPNVFERFARGDTSRSRAAGSTGLGLAIVAAVVAAHHGTVEVASVPGSTVFTVRSCPGTPGDLTAPAQRRHTTGIATASTVDVMQTTYRNPPAGRAAIPFRASATGGGRPVLDVVIPVYNEEHDLAPCVRGLHAYLTEHFPYPFRITVADNASTDATPVIAAELAEEFLEVAVRPAGAEGHGGGRCARSGRPRTRPCSPTWTSTCPPTSPRCCRWWRR